MKVLVQLIGGQPLPNLLPPLSLKPDKTILVYTLQTERVMQRVESVIGQCEKICCDAYDIEDLADLLQQALDSYHGDDLIFNLTGGTKAMVLGANQIAIAKGATVVYLESERAKNVLYRYRYEGQTLRPESKDVLPTLINIEQFLDAHIGKGQWQQTGPSKDIGGPFEKAVGDAIRKLLPGAEVYQGVRFLGSQDGGRTQVDLDIVVRCGNQFARIECKSKNTSTLDAAKQLNLVTELLGTYTRKFIAMTQTPNPEHQAVYEATRTTVIQLSSFNDNSRDGLSEEDQRCLARAISESIHCEGGVLG